MKHFYLMHGMMGECPEGDESGAYVSAIDAKSEITDLQKRLADLTKRYEDVRYEHASEKSAREQLEIQLYDLREKLEKAEAWEKLAGIDLATAQAQVKRLGEGIIKAQAAVVCGNMNEVAHQLYCMADPTFTSLTPFAEMEEISGISLQSEIDKLKQALEGSNKIVDKSNEITINDGLDD